MEDAGRLWLYGFFSLHFFQPRSGGLLVLILGELAVVLFYCFGIPTNIQFFRSILFIASYYNCFFLSWLHSLFRFIACFHAKCAGDLTAVVLLSDRRSGWLLLVAGRVALAVGLFCKGGG